MRMNMVINMQHAMTDPATVPHALNERFQTLSISTLQQCYHVIVVALNRPRKRNAINAKMWREIGKLFEVIGTVGDGCRCVLLVGHGKAFSAGLDTSDPSLLMGIASSDRADVARAAIANKPQIVEMQRCFTAVSECPVPVVAAIHGPCIGAGVDLICCADVRFACADTVFSVREVRLGLAADVGTLQRLPKLVGNDSLVRQLCLTGDDFDAALAKKIGFVSQVANNYSDLMQMACSVCQRIASNSPVAVAGTKISLNYSRDHTVAQGLDHIASHNSVALMTNDIMASFTTAGNGNEGPTFDNLLPHSKL